MRHTYSVLSIAVRHPLIFSHLTNKHHYGVPKGIIMNKTIVSQRERNAILKVAQEANKRNANPTKEEMRLGDRLNDYSSMLATKNSGATKAQLRKENGGYHRPGSMQKH